VYALGLLLCRLLTNQLPGWAGDPIAFLAQPSVPAIEPLPEIDGVPADVNELYLRCVARDPAQRPSAREAAVVLAAAAGIRAPLGQSSTYLEDDSTSLTHDIEKISTTVGTSRRRRHRQRALIGTSVVLVGAALAAVLAARSNGIAPAAGSAAVGGSGPGAVAETPDTYPTPGAPTTDPSENPSGGANISGASRPVVAATVAGAPGVTESADPPPAPSSTVESPTPVQVATTFDSAGGSIVVTCANGKAELLSWTPADGYTVKRRVKGPAARVAVAFKSDTATVGMIVTCPNNQPRLVIKDSDT
jgi:serine/threonine protein kinase